MLKSVSKIVGMFAAISVLSVATMASADGKAAPAPPNVVAITNVTWGLAMPGGVGTFRVTVSSSATLRAGAVWVQAVSAGAPTLQGPIGAVAKPGSLGAASVAGTANGRCYTVKLAIEPDSSGAGITLDPKNSSRKVCLDPDGTGIVH
jgi:hypothetical protein